MNASLELYLLIDLNLYPDRFNVIDALLLSLHFYSAAADSRAVDPGHEEKLKVNAYVILVCFALKKIDFCFCSKCHYLQFDP